MNKTNASEKWNLRFCPKCKGHIRIGKTKTGSGQIAPVKYCQNNPTCGYKVVLTKENISNTDRHKVIEEHFGYSKPFVLDVNSFESLVTDELLFANTIGFMDWYLQELSKYQSLNHNTLPVSSPYWLIVRNIGKFVSENCAGELKETIQKNWRGLSEGEKRNVRENSGFEYSLFW